VEKVMNNAHAHPVQSLDTVGNLLYSTSLKSLKLWDLHEMKQISDIEAHRGVIKCVKAMHKFGD